MSGPPDGTDDEPTASFRRRVKHRVDTIADTIDGRSTWLTRTLLVGSAAAIMGQPVMAQTAVQEAAGVACDGPLGQGIFLGLGILALFLAIVGIGQIAAGFWKTGPGGGMGKQSSGRGGIVNGAITFAGALFLGGVGGLLAAVGVDLGSCLSGDIITMTPPDVVVDVVLALI